MFERIFSIYFYYPILIILASFLSACSSQIQEYTVKIEPAKEFTQPESARQVLPQKSPTKKVSVAQTQTNNTLQEIELPKMSPLEVEGNLTIAGSSTLFPLNKAIYERFIQEGFIGTIKLDSIGSGAGFRLFCQQTESGLDIASASRAIKFAEIDRCLENGRDPIEFRVGTDALAVVIHPDNYFLNSVTISELAAIFTSEKWSDVNPYWPDEVIERFIPDLDSGTLDFFVDIVLNGDVRKIVNLPNTETSGDDDYLVQEVSTNKYAIGFFGYAYYQENAKTLRILAIDGVEPNIDTAENGSYPLARPLFLYSDRNLIQTKPQIGKFINFYLTNVNKEIYQVGYFPANPNSLNTSKIKLLEAMGYEDFRD